MRLIAVTDAATAPSVRRQIRAPEEVLEAPSERLSDLLEAGLRRWEELTEKERADSSLLLVSDCDMRRDAVDYLRKTYVPGRAVTLFGQDPLLVKGVHCCRMEASFCVMLSARAVRALGAETVAMMRSAAAESGSEGLILGWQLSGMGVKCGAVGASVQYARPLVNPTMAAVDAAGDYLSR